MSDPKKYDQVRIITNPLSSSKTLDADVMIENILSKNQVFLKKAPNSFPLWLTPGSGKVPSLYEQVWKRVQCPRNPGFCNTQVLSQIFMTSGLSTQVLGFIWNLVNKKCMGVLSEEELYLSLALIAISQNGTIIHNVDILKQIIDPMIPRLDINLIKQYSAHHYHPMSMTNAPQNKTSQNNVYSAQTINLPNQPGTSGLKSTSITSKINTFPAQDSTENIKDSGVSSIDWGNEDDEFSEFQSGTVIDTSQNLTKLQLQNVSITLNPIDYFMSSDVHLGYKENKLSSVNASNVFVNTTLTDTQKTVGNKCNAIEEDDEFSDFQSSTLDFDIEIKQPNILKNIKTIMDGKNPSRDTNSNKQIIEQTNENKKRSTHINEISQNDNKANEAFKLTATNSAHELGKQKERDYSALKEIQIDQSPVDQISAIAESTDNNMSKSFLDSQPNGESTLVFTDTKNVLGKSHIQTEKTLSNLFDDNIMFNQSPSFEVSFNKKINNSSLNTNNINNNYTFPNLVNNNNFPKINENTPDDEFTEFTQAVSIDSKINSGYHTASSASSINANVANIAPSTIDIHCSEQHKQSVSKKNIDFLFNDFNETTQIDLNKYDNNDNFDDFKQATFESTTSESKIELLESNVDQTYSDDEFTDFEQATIVHPSLTIVKSNESYTIAFTDFSSQHDEKKSDDLTDKYSALRHLNFSGNDDAEEEDVEKERDASDGDNISLQLPSIGTHEQDTVQMKCYEVCIYTLESSLNFFLSSEIDSTDMSNPQIIEHLKCLFEIYQVGKRIEQSVSSISNSKLDSIYSVLSAYCSEATSFEFHQPNEDFRGDIFNSAERCEICLSSQHNTSLVQENNLKYHAQCANLYLHFVDATLP